jgi:hypothetical protein
MQQGAVGRSFPKAAIMSVEFIGYIDVHLQSDIIPARAPAPDRAHVEQAARIHEDGGFDRALVEIHSTSPEGILVASHAASVTGRLGLLICHRRPQAAQGRAKPCQPRRLLAPARF